MKQEATKLQTVIRNVSRFQLGSQSKNQNVRIQQLASDESVHSHFMCIILVSGPALKITFKSHFKSAAARTLSSPIYSLPEDKITEVQALDFFRELNNLTAGSIKHVLNIQNIDVGLSLPIITRGFDEIFFPRQKSSQHFHDCWQLVSPHTNFICTSTIELFEDVDLSKIDDKFDGSLHSGDVEFF